MCLSFMSEKLLLRTQYILLYLKLVSCNLIGQLNGWHFLMSHGFYKGYWREGDISTRAPRGTDRSPEYNEHFC